jgi:hypothetical protein
MIRRALLLALMALAAVPAVAAASPSQIFEDCQDGRLDKRYSDGDYRGALSDIPPDLDEYTNCRELIRSAQQGVRGGGGSGPGSNFNDADGYGALPAGEGGLPLGPDSKPIDPAGIASAEERKDLEAARKGLAGTDRSTDADGPRAIPAGAAERPDQANGAELPGALIVLLVLIGGAVVAALVPRLRDLVLRRST